jgi:transglutaminase-like putative cysteine protease
VSTALAPPPRKHFVDAPPRASVRARQVRTMSNDPVLSAWVARLIAFAALAGWGALHWMSMLEPSEPGRGWTILLVGLIAAVAMLGAGRLQGRRAHVVAALSLLPLVALALLAGRVSDELLLPTGWSELAGGISRGLSDLPGVRVPYRGLDQWVRTDLALGGAVLVLVAAVLAFWPRRERLGFPIAALMVLVALYVVPVVALDFTGEFVRGAVFTLLMVAFLLLEKLRRADAVAAFALAIVATFVAFAAAPLLNRDQPWFDYETWAAETSTSKSTSFRWEHSYEGLNWPRDGRELLRVRARQPAYWKAENLDVFDGQRWLRSQVNYAVPEFPENNPKLVKRWTQRLTVSIRNLRSDQFITAGYAIDVDIPRLVTVPTLDGLVVPPRTLRRGDTYTADVYTPRPSENQRRHSSIDYEGSLDHYTTVIATTPGITGAPRATLTFPFFGSEDQTIRIPEGWQETPEQLMQRSNYTRIYQLAQRLKADARTPEDVVQNVLEFLGDTAVYTYSETPPPASRTLDGFLFESKQGYCQQFSGAMALLLRMAGIPARVTTGFSTGATDTTTGEYVVRDFDAHSWVEVYYPDDGWITFDPTPAASPARSQPADAASISGSSTGARPIQPQDLPFERGAGIPVASESRPWWQYPLFALALLVAGALGFLAVRRRRRGAPPALSEFERALKRTRRDLAPGTTLHALELSFAGTPAAAAYVRALRESRYRDAPARPTRAQRRGLRSELGRGRGMLGHLRAWWALPPR